MLDMKANLSSTSFGGFLQTFEVCKSVRVVIGSENLLTCMVEDLIWHLRVFEAHGTIAHQ